MANEWVLQEDLPQRPREARNEPGRPKVPMLCLAAGVKYVYGVCVHMHVCVSTSYE